MSDKPDLPPEAADRAAPGIDDPAGTRPDAGSGPDAVPGDPAGELPTRQDRSGLEPPISTDEEPPDGTAELDRR